MMVALNPRPEVWGESGMREADGDKCSLSTLTAPVQCHGRSPELGQGYDLIGYRA